jgi:hypothetical protein
MVDTKPLLKGFGAAVDVAGQIATDKAVNSRRIRSDFSQFDITKGQLIENISTINGRTEVPHKLGRKAIGAMIVRALDPATPSGAGEIFCESADSEKVVIRANDIFADVIIWVV